ncbi:hypothetical protein GCM10009060_11420 [Halorubrum trapanicum]
MSPITSRSGRSNTSGALVDARRGERREIAVRVGNPDRRGILGVEAFGVGVAGVGLRIDRDDPRPTVVVLAEQVEPERGLRRDQFLVGPVGERHTLSGRVRLVRVRRYPGDESLKRRSPDLSGMELRVIEKTDTELNIEIAGEDHTFMNVLKGALLESEDVAAATYDVNPEQSGGQTEPVLTVKSEEEDPLDVLADAAESITERTDALRDAVRAA